MWSHVAWNMYENGSRDNKSVRMEHAHDAANCLMHWLMAGTDDLMRPLKDWNVEKWIISKGRSETASTSLPKCMFTRQSVPFLFCSLSHILLNSPYQRFPSIKSVSLAYQWINVLPSFARSTFWESVCWNGSGNQPFLVPQRALTPSPIDCSWLVFLNL